MKRSTLCLHLLLLSLVCAASCIRRDMIYRNRKNMLNRRQYSGFVQRENEDEEQRSFDNSKDFAQRLREERRNADGILADKNGPKCYGSQCFGKKDGILADTKGPKCYGSQCFGKKDGILADTKGPKCYGSQCFGKKDGILADKNGPKCYGSQCFGKKDGVLADTKGPKCYGSQCFGKKDYESHRFHPLVRKDFVRRLREEKRNAGRILAGKNGQAGCEGSKCLSGGKK